MFSHMLFLAAVAAEPAGKAEGVTKLFSDFGIDWPLLLAQMLSFSVVAFLLWRFAFKPILATLEDRQRQIEAGLKYAEEMKAKLAQTQEQSAAILKQAQLDGAKFFEDARRTAREFLDSQHKEAAARTDDMIAKARQAIELEHKKMLGQARLEVARLVVAVTQRVLSKELSEAERTRYNEAAGREITVL